MKFGQLTNSRKRATARNIARTARGSAHVRLGGELLTRDEIIHVRAKLLREKEEWQRDIGHKTRNRLAVKKLLRNAMKQQLLQVCTLLRNQQHGKKPTVYQVLGYLTQAKGNIRDAELLFAANVMNIEGNAGRALWEGNPGFILPLLRVRKTPHGNMTWLESINHLIRENPTKPISTSELSRNAGVGSTITDARRTNAALQLLQTIQHAERLPDKIINGRPTAMWQAAGKPVRADYPNIFMDLMKRIPHENNEWIRLAQLHAPKKTIRGEKKAPTVGNPNAPFTSTAVRAAVETLETAGIIKIRREKIQFLSSPAQNMDVDQYFVAFTPVGKRLWLEHARTGILPPRLVHIFTSREAD